MLNIELKFRCDDLRSVRDAAIALGAVDQGTFAQRDEFFEAPNARLKLREQAGALELISYVRSDRPDATPSEWHVFRTENSGDLRGVLFQALGVAIVVEKQRHLLLLEHTRIHLDTVEGLGTFVELETLTGTDLDADAARAEVIRIASSLSLSNAEPIAVAYVDLQAD